MTLVAGGTQRVNHAQLDSLQNLLGIVPAPTNNAGSMAELPPAKAGQGKCGEEALARGHVYHLLMRYLCHIHALLVM